MSNHDCKTGKVMPFPSGETTARILGFRHLLKTDRMRLPDDPVDAPSNFFARWVGLCR
jgi:hypothetical protein